MLKVMDQLAESLEKMMSHEEILRRFQKIFGREMTESERAAFFVPPQIASKKDES